MKCDCGAETKCLDTRQVSAQVVRRRHWCPTCGAKFTTRERIERAHNQRSAIINATELETLNRLFAKAMNVVEGVKE